MPWSHCGNTGDKTILRSIFEFLRLRSRWSRWHSFEAWEPTTTVQWHSSGLGDQASSWNSNNNPSSRAVAIQKTTSQHHLKPLSLRSLLWSPCIHRENWWGSPKPARNAQPPAYVTAADSKRLTNLAIKVHLWRIVMQPSRSSRLAKHKFMEQIYANNMVF